MPFTFSTKPPTFLNVSFRLDVIFLTPTNILISTPELRTSRMSPFPKVSDIVLAILLKTLAIPALIFVIIFQRPLKNPKVLLELESSKPFFSDWPNSFILSMALERKLTTLLITFPKKSVSLTESLKLVKKSPKEAAPSSNPPEKPLIFLNTSTIPFANDLTALKPMSNTENTPLNADLSLPACSSLSLNLAVKSRICSANL